MIYIVCFFFFFFSSRRRHTRSLCDWSSDVCSSDLKGRVVQNLGALESSALPANTSKNTLFNSPSKLLALLFLPRPSSHCRFRSEERRVGKECRNLCVVSRCIKKI